MLRIGIVAGEVSGDLLGARLIKEIKEQYSDVEVVGIGGKKLIEQGCRSLFDMQLLSIIGFSELFSRFFKILKIRKQLVEYFLNNPPDVFIGIDAPDFNLVLEEKLRANGIKVVHYIGPTIWAWRRYRLKRIARAVDLMLLAFPFELPYYQKHNITARFVGHPLANQLQTTMNQHDARDALGIPIDKRIIALMPGSRFRELKHLVPIFLQTALRCQQQHSDLHFVVNAIDMDAKQMLDDALQSIGQQLPISIFIDDSIRVMQASDVLLLASGTITLEAMFLKKPMVVAYKTSWLSCQIFKRLSYIRYIALPNLLANKLLVPEYVQHDCRPEVLSSALSAWLCDSDAVAQLQREFVAIHQCMLQEENNSAMHAVLSLIENRL